MIVYIAGPMTGIEDYNRPAFAEAAKSVSANGDTPINPGLLPTTLRPESYMPICLAMIDAADAVILLPGWEGSEGARLERLYALRQGKKVYVAKWEATP